MRYLGWEPDEVGIGVAQVFLVVAEDGRQVMNMYVTGAPGNPDGHVVTRGGWCCPDSGCE